MSPGQVGEHPEIAPVLLDPPKVWVIWAEDGSAVSTSPRINPDTHLIRI
jgi:hypothetical protein